MEQQPTLMLEQELIKIVRALSPARARQILDFALFLLWLERGKPDFSEFRESLTRTEPARVRETREDYATMTSYSVVSDEKFQESLNRSLKENAEIWAELAKR